MRSNRVILSFIVAIVSFIAFAAPVPVAAQRGVPDCEDFSSQEQAQAVFEDRNSNLPELDPDGNGVACDDQDYVFQGKIKDHPTETPISEETPLPSASATSDGDASASTGVKAATHTAIYEGDCQPGAFVDPVVFLTDPELPSGPSVGSGVSVRVATSYSTIPVSLENVTTTPHVLVVFDPDQPDRVFACGPIAGAVEADGSLAIALQPGDGGTGYGVAYLSATADDALGVSLFVVHPES